MERVGVGPEPVAQNFSLREERQTRIAVLVEVDLRVEVGVFEVEIGPPESERVGETQPGELCPGGRIAIRTMVGVQRDDAVDKQLAVERDGCHVRGEIETDDLLVIDVGVAGGGSPVVEVLGHGEEKCHGVGVAEIDPAAAPGHRLVDAEAHGPGRAQLDSVRREPRVTGSHRCGLVRLGAGRRHAIVSAAPLGQEARSREIPRVEARGDPVQRKRVLSQEEGPLTACSPAPVLAPQADVTPAPAGADHRPIVARARGGQHSARVRRQVVCPPVAAAERGEPIVVFVGAPLHERHGAHRRVRRQHQELFAARPAVEIGQRVEIGRVPDQAKRK